MRYVIVGALFALLPVSAYATPGTAPADAVVISGTPNGQGDLNAWTCRKPMELDGPGFHARRFGPEVCQTNQFWADLIKNHDTVDAKGGVVLTSKPGIGSWGDVGGGVARSEPYTFDAHR
jgi:hypothetical protein